MGSWFKKHVSKPSKAVVKGIVRTPTNISHSVMNLVRHPTDIKAWGNVALQVNPVTAIPRSIATEGMTSSANRKIDLFAGIGATTLAAAGAGTMVRAGMAGASVLGSSGGGASSVEGESFAPGTDLSNVQGASDLVLPNTPSSPVESPSFDITKGVSQAVKNLFNSGGSGGGSTPSGSGSTTSEAGILGVPSQYVFWIAAIAAIIFFVRRK